MNPAAATPMRYVSAAIDAVHRPSGADETKTGGTGAPASLARATAITAPSFARVTRPLSVAVLACARESRDTTAAEPLDAASGSVVSRDPCHHHSTASTAMTNPSTPARRRTVASYINDSGQE